MHAAAWAWLLHAACTPVARAHPAAAEPPLFAEVDCITVVDKAAQPTLHIAYTVPVDDTEFGMGDIPLPDAKTHQFFAFRAALFPRNLGYASYGFELADTGDPIVLPEWIAAEDVERAAQGAGAADGTNFSVADVPPDAMLESNPAFDGLWQRVTADDARVPITLAQSLKGVDWDLSGVEPGLYTVAGYIFSPPYNAWAPRSDLVKIVEPGHDMPAAVIDTVHEFVYSYQGRRVTACVDTPQGSKLDAAFRVEERPQDGWMPWIADREIGSGPLELCFHNPLANVTGSVRLRFEIVAPDGSAAVFYSFDTLTALHGEGECIASDTLCCDFTAPPAPASRPQDAGEGSGAPPAETSRAPAESSSGCGVVRGTRAVTPLAPLLGWIVWAIGQRRARRRRALRTLARLCACAALLGCGTDGGSATGGAEQPPMAGARSVPVGGSGTSGAPAVDAAIAADSGAPAPMAVVDTKAWTQMGFDATSRYHNPGERTLSVSNAGQIELKWAFTVAGYPPGAPAVAEGQVFALATGGMYAIDLNAGTELWSRTDLTGFSSVAYADGFLYVHTESAELYKLAADDGATVWGPVKSYDHPAADGTSSPIVAEDKVLVGHSTFAEFTDEGRAEARGGVAAFDTATGDEVWRYYTVELPENGAMVWSSVSVDLARGVVYATTGNDYTVSGSGSDAFHAIDLSTGERLWARQVRENDVWVLGVEGGDTDFGANPIVADAQGRRLLAAGDKAGAFWALDRDTGDLVWSRTDLSESHGPAAGGVLNNGAFDGEAFYLVSNDPLSASAVLHALDPTSGVNRWQPRAISDRVVWGMLTIANGLLFVPANHELHIYDTRNGDLLNLFDTGGTIAAGGAAIADGRVVVKSGLMYPETGVTTNDQILCYGLP